VTDRRVRDYSRMLFAGASNEVTDAQGRITIPPPLREYAGLDRECAVIGANTRIEIWNGPAWQQYQAQAEQAFADIAEEVLPGVL
jgi:MraZ protein